MNQDERTKALAIGITKDSNCATSALAKGYAKIAQDAVPIPLAPGVSARVDTRFTLVSIASDIWDAAGEYAKCF